MKNMRRILTVAVLVMVLGLTACGGSDKGGSSKTSSGGGYTFTSGSTKIEMSSDAPEGANLNTPKRILHFFEKVVAVVLKFSK